MTKKKRISAFTIIVGALLAIYVLSILFMFLWALNTSLKTSETFDHDVLGITKDFAFDNYLTAFAYGFSISVESGAAYRSVYIEEMFLNSMFYSVGSAICQTACTCIVAYLVVKYDNAFSRFFHKVIIVTLILPIVGALPSQIQIMNFLQLKDHFIGMYIMKFGCTNIYYLIFYAAFKNLSWGYAEAALIDGANHFQIFFKVMLPLVMSLCGVCTLIFFIEYWNDYQIPMLFLRNNPVIAWGLYDFFQSYDQKLSTPVVKISGGVMVLIPLIVLFLIFRNKLMGNLTEGGMKE